MIKITAKERDYFQESDPTDQEIEQMIDNMNGNSNITEEYKAMLGHDMDSWISNHKHNEVVGY